MSENGALAFRVEQVCLNAWPALNQVILDGWLLRFAGGFTRRANSVNPLFPGSRPIESKIAVCEEIYAAQGLPAVFRLPEFLEPELEPLLQERGYPPEDETSVRYMALASFRGAAEPDVECARRPSPEWLAAQAKLSQQNERDRRVYARIVAAIAVPAVFAGIRAEDRLVALAYGALHDRIICVNSVVTDPAFRRQGLSRRIMAAILAWGQKHGAEGACLQAVAANSPAIALYRQIGFDRELYRYHYRRRPAP